MNSQANHYQVPSTIVTNINGESSVFFQHNTEDVDRFLSGVESLIKLCGDDPKRVGLVDTPNRVLQAFLEYTDGLRFDPATHLEKTFSIKHDELVLVKNIEFHSICEHHFAPFFGVAHVGYWPSSKITGLSKIARTVEGYAKRFQVQERLTQQIIDALEKKLSPKGTMIVIEAKHMCMCGRGIKKGGALTVTTGTRGVFKEQRSYRDEFLSLIR